jgi:hypothetical protein
LPGRYDHRQDSRPDGRRQGFPGFDHLRQFRLFLPQKRQAIRQDSGAIAASRLIVGLTASLFQTHNLLVAGSNPAGPIRLWSIAWRTNILRTYYDARRLNLVYDCRLGCGGIAALIQHLAPSSTVR